MLSDVDADGLLNEESWGSDQRLARVRGSSHILSGGHLASNDGCSERRMLGERNPSFINLLEHPRLLG
jgi:hypothetical protein